MSFLTAGRARQAPKAGQQDRRRLFRILTPTLKFRAHATIARQGLRHRMEMQGGIRLQKEFATARLSRRTISARDGKGRPHMVAIDALKSRSDDHGADAALGRGLQPARTPAQIWPQAGVRRCAISWTAPSGLLAMVRHAPTKRGPRRLRAPVAHQVAMPSRWPGEGRAHPRDARRCPGRLLRRAHGIDNVKVDDPCGYGKCRTQRAIQGQSARRAAGGLAEVAIDKVASLEERSLKPLPCGRGPDASADAIAGEGNGLSLDRDPSPQPSPQGGSGSQLPALSKTET